jgi:pimeloyl-ACP methyl ester carboxylesterase
MGGWGSHCDEVIEFHSGYLDAFELVWTDIEGVLKGASFDQLFITGHSLGGALAIVATRILASEITGSLSRGLMASEITGSGGFTFQVHHAWRFGRLLEVSGSRDTFWVDDSTF